MNKMFRELYIFASKTKKTSVSSAVRSFWIFYATNYTVFSDLGPELQCLLRVKEDLS